MVEVQRSTLVVAPTIDLMNQWYDLLTRSFAVEVGLLGGGYHELADLTVATYDSAYMQMDRYGNRFGLIVFDEVHHLPGENVQPRRRNVPSALPPRADGHAGTRRRSPRTPRHPRRSHSL